MITQFLPGSRVLACALAVGLAACSGEGEDQDFDRADLLARMDPEVRSELRQAGRHILVVRHARKVSPDCNALDCPLSAEGEAMVGQLSGLLGDLPVEAAYASAACRTQRTAEAGGAPVTPHQASDGLAEGCDADESVTRLRLEAFAEGMASGARWTLVAEHSNTVCAWIVAFAGDGGVDASGCEDGRLSEDAYGDIYWLYQTEPTAWGLAVLPGAFDVPVPAPVTSPAPEPLPDTPDAAEPDAELAGPEAEPQR